MKLIKTLHDKFVSADIKWQRQLEIAFGNEASERRYEYAREDHPRACLLAELKRSRAETAFVQHGGHAALVRS